MTFADEIERKAGEPIEAIVIGPFGWGSMGDEPGYGEKDVRESVLPNRGIVQNWADVRRMLDYDYGREFGAPGCDAIWAYTKRKVLFVSEYDGSTTIVAVPRNPEPGVPSMPGGG